MRYMQTTNRKHRLAGGMLAAILSVSTIAGFAQNWNTADLLLDCRRHTDNAARLACYDEVADQLCLPA